MSNTNGAIVRAEGLTKVFTLPAEEIVAVDHIDLDIEPGDFVTIMGPSGSGKTTLLDLLGCMESATSGKLTVLGRDVSGASEDELVTVRRARIGFVFQEFLLLPELTAVENVRLPAVFARQPMSRDEAMELLKRVGLEARANHLPKELSGGERQRVAIARSLAMSSDLLLADEPTGNLDSKNSRGVFDLFRELNDAGLTIIATTHDEKLGATAKRSIRLVDGRLAA
jgi:putative ABC transport system ATP-binding protein